MKNKKIILIFIIFFGVITLFLYKYFISNDFNDTNKIEYTIQEERDYATVDNNLVIEDVFQSGEKTESDNFNEGDNLIVKENETIDNNNSNSNNKDDSSKNNDESKNDVLYEDKLAENEKKEISSEFKLCTLGNLQYYLYIPSNPTTNMPLIMYLHGGTNKKSDVELLLTTDGFPKYLYDGFYGDLRAYVVIPKLANTYTSWADIADDLQNLIKNINLNCGIDLNKVSLTGHSMGGTGTYQLQVKLPNTFACIAPMSGSIRNTKENLNALSKTKVWAFIGTNDTIVNPNSSRIIISSLKENGANAQLTELEDATHFDVPSQAYKNSEVIKWLVNCGR